MKDRCEDWTTNGRCRNKAVTVIPANFKVIEGRSLCRKHADKKAQDVLDSHAQLVWALRWRELNP